MAARRWRCSVAVWPLPRLRARGAVASVGLMDRVPPTPWHVHTRHAPGEPQKQCARPPTPHEPISRSCFPHAVNPKACDASPPAFPPSSPPPPSSGVTAYMFYLLRRVTITRHGGSRRHQPRHRAPSSNTHTHTPSVSAAVGDFGAVILILFLREAEFGRTGSRRP